MVDKVTMGVILAIPGGITALALLPAGHLADRIGRKMPIVVGLALLIATALSLWLTPDLHYPRNVAIISPILEGDGTHE